MIAFGARVRFIQDPGTVRETMIGMTGVWLPIQAGSHFGQVRLDEPIVFSEDGVERRRSHVQAYVKDLEEL